MGYHLRVGSDDLEPEYLTRSDIARILKISAKQAGRLMNQMPTVRVGRTHRRVSKSDFYSWTLRERQTPAENSNPREAAMRAAARYAGFKHDNSGSVFKAAEAMKRKGLSAC